MRDRRVGQHPLDVPLDERGEVADRERDAGDDRDGDRPQLVLGRERGHEHTHHQHDGDRLRGCRHERRHRGRGALVDVGCPLMERCRRRLEAQPGQEHREPGEQHRIVRQALRARRLRDLSEAELAGGAEDERRAEQQHGRAEAADDQVLQARLERADEVELDRAEDVERNREPLQPEEERHQVVGLHEERHTAAGRRQQRVELGCVRPARAAAVGDPDGQDPGSRHDQLGERAEAVAHHRVGDHRLRVRALPEQQGRGDERAGEGAGGQEGGERGLRPARDEDGGEQDGARPREQDERGREREPVDRRSHRVNCSSTT